jgi:hypothetical protein
MVISFIGGGSPEKTTDLVQVTAKHYHLKVVSSTPHHLAGFKLTTLVVIRTDCTGSCKSNYHMVTIMSLPPAHNIAN